jgi:hypothetical protein
VKEKLAGIRGLNGDALRVALVDLCNVIHAEKPAKAVFSSDRVTRKGQMADYKNADNVWRQSLALVFRTLDESGNAESKVRFAGSVTSSGIVSIRQTNALALRPAKSGRITL